MPGLPSPIITSRWAWALPLKPRSAAWRSGATSGRALPVTLHGTPQASARSTAFFYPQEEYRRDLLDGIAEMVRLGVGDVEVHLHHDNEQRESFIRKDHRILPPSHGRSRTTSPAGRPHGFWLHPWQLGARQLAPGRQVVRPQRRNRPAARSRLLRRFHHAVASLADPGPRGEPDLLVHEQSRQSAEVLRSRNRSHGRRRQSAATCS